MDECQVQYNKMGWDKHQIRRKYDTLYLIAYNGLAFILGKSVTLDLKPEKKGNKIMLCGVVG